MRPATLDTTIKPANRTHAPIPPTLQASIAPEVLAAMTARGTEFLPGAAGPAVEAFIRKTIEKEQAEDNFYV